jgi:NAD(P)-dependent dehydrogenase (short-subunit alcohol dehydrogenase family)
MQVSGKTVVVTGGANGIGRALCESFHRAGAAKIVVADIDSAAARVVAASVDGAAFKCDVGKENDILHLIDETERLFGPIALFCSNAGIGGGFDPLSENAGGSSDEPWSRSWAVHVMAHVYAARHLIPRMKARGEGYFLNTISAAGLLSQVGSSAYSTTKHAAVGFAENLAISHKADGIKVSILCPQGVDTNMLRSIPKGPQSGDGDLSPEQVARDALAGIEQETFLILPHPQVLGYMRKKTENYDRWIAGMAKIQARMREEQGKA